jgi:sec-independent protein translocase protein TatA
MGGFSIWHWLVVGVIILLLFGKGRFSEMMGDVAKGLKSFKKGMSEDDEAAAPAKAAEPPRRLTDEATVAPPAERSREPEAGERREP